MIHGDPRQCGLLRSHVKWLSTVADGKRHIRNLRLTSASTTYGRGYGKKHSMRLTSAAYGFDNLDKRKPNALR